MSYRSFKHLLGETSLERKCRFIFGGGILVLVTLSFYWYGQRTEALVIDQTTHAARMQVNPYVMNLHYKAMGNNDFASVMEVLWGDLASIDEMSNYDSTSLKPYKLMPPRLRKSRQVRAGGTRALPPLGDGRRRRPQERRITQALYFH